MSCIHERAKRLVSVDEFADTSLPQKLDRLTLFPPQEEVYILRMPIRVEGGRVCLPTQYLWVAPILFHANFNQTQMGVAHPFVYLTIRHGIVKSVTDDQWHVDGFSTKIPHTPEQNYIWSSHTGTEYVPLNVNVPEDFSPRHHNINTYLARTVDDTKVQQCEEKTLYCMDPYILHRRPAETAGVWRTFVRISFVPIEINDINNTQNPELPRQYTADGVAFRNMLRDYSTNT